MLRGLLYILSCTLFQKQSPGVILQKIKNLLKSYQYSNDCEEIHLTEILNTSNHVLIP